MQEIFDKVLQNKFLQLIVFLLILILKMLFVKTKNRRLKR